MKTICAAIVALLMSGPVYAQQYAATDGYRVCPQSQTNKGLEVVQQACGVLKRPNFSAVQFNSLNELRVAEQARARFSAQVADYGVCVTQFINSYRRPGAPADSQAPDQAACAHAWAEDQATQTVREYGKACVEFSNRSMTDKTLKPWAGDCYPTALSGQG